MLWGSWRSRVSGGRRVDASPTVGLVWWGDVFEDFLDRLGVSLEVFQKDFRGSWTFAYFEALRSAGVTPILYGISRRVQAPLRFTHRPSNCEVRVLPAPWLGRRIERWLDDKRSRESQSTRVVQAVVEMLGTVAPYLTTPLVRMAIEWQRDGCSAIICQQYEYERFDLCVPLGWLLGRPVFGVNQGGYQLLGRLQKCVRWLAVRASAGLIIGARDEVLRVRLRYRLRRENVGQIFNPIDTDVWRPVSKVEARESIGLPLDATVAIWHGRVEIAQKGLDLLLEAWAQICQAWPNQELRLMLVGTGGDAERLSHLLDTARLRGVVWVRDFVNDTGDLRRYLSAADVYVFPSRAEGFPVAPLEAMACELPVVAADVQGIRDIFAEGEASGGVIIPVGDVAALAAALARVMNDQALCRQLGSLARQRAEAAFSIETVGRQLVAFLRWTGRWPRCPADIRTPA